MSLCGLPLCVIYRSCAHEASSVRLWEATDPLVVVLQSVKSVSEDQIRAVLSTDYTVTTEETYDIYLLPPGEDPETCQSYLRMRNRDGKYSLMFEVGESEGVLAITSMSRMSRSITQISFVVT